MIPYQLHLVNFLSYQDCHLDFTHLHTACICGPNGSGKSSLLEGLTWALWGKSRAESDDDVVRSGTTEVRVDLSFGCEGQHFRVIRTRTRTKSGSLEFQVGAEDGSFRTLTRHTMRLTQAAINEVLKMDYDTFINSAYLRQGRADEFTLKPPAERKQVLIEILNLSRYDLLCEQSKEREKTHAAQAQALKEALQRNKTLIAGRTFTLAQQAHFQAELAQQRATESQLQQHLDLYKAQQRQREQLEQHLGMVSQRLVQIEQSRERIHNQLERQTRTVKEIEALLELEAQIEQGVLRHRQLQTEEATLSEQVTRQQHLQQHRQELERAREVERHTLTLQHQRHASRLEYLQGQRKEAERILQESDKVEQGITQLKRAREILTSYDQRQRDVFPLLQHKQQLEETIKAQQFQLEAQLEHCEQQIQRLQQDSARKAFLEKTLVQVDERLELLEKKRVYQLRVIEKGQERRGFKDRLELQQQQYLQQQTQLADKTRLLGEQGVGCPLCGQTLEEEHRQVLHKQHDRQQTELDEQLVLLRHQISSSEHEIRVLRGEYAELEKELDTSASWFQKQAQYRSQLKVIEESTLQIASHREQSQGLKQQLERSSFAQATRTELASVIQQIQLVNYDDKDHSMIRNEVERWRWAEIRYQEIERARKQYAQLEAEIPPLEQQVNELSQQLAGEHFAPEIRGKLEHVCRQISELAYDPHHHQQVRKQLQDTQSWLLRQQEWQKARNRHPEELQHLEELRRDSETCKHDFTTCLERRTQLETEFKQSTDQTETITTYEARLKVNRQQQDSQLSQLGAIEQQLAHLDALEEQLTEQQRQFTHAQQQQQLWRELVRAFGKNGIPALIIENVLPELEAETNQLLARLCNNQLHIQFVTQKATNNAKKFIDTLDILIADARGTRPYETYSGGEAYRVNFAIRLALSRLLARRSGAALQTLIIDEGFGTQDQEGRERLVQSINAVADDFARILVITHIQELKEAFQSRIEVEKNHQGSQLSVIV
ncbi:MAG: AAA family ATPase [Gemmatimonadaceae bacterium]|nr:AAA family ATPase [Gloeobacterales cyanobacterium ES-bin-141]